MATRENVEEKLEELISRLDASDDGVRSLQGSLPERRTLALRVPDLDAEYWTELADGRMGPLQAGPPERIDIAITIGSDDLIDLIDGRRNLFPAYLMGQVKIDASPGDLLRLRKLL